ncbi:MAG: NADH-quinone oxidoreductase subunit L [Gaiellales bacterium]
MTELVWITLALPLIGVAVLTILGMKLPARGAGWFASLIMLAAFGCAAVATIILASRPEEERQVVQVAWTWLSAGNFSVGLDLWFDELTAVMLLVITGVGFLIHVYSIWYMEDDPQSRRFMAYLNLFVFSMLLLVLSANLVLLLAGWGLVGLSSYLLIGFWHNKPKAIKAAKKAFIMNAIGDVGIALGAFLLFVDLGTLSYSGIFAGAPSLTETQASIACLLLLVGAVAKSAQLPLHTWLPDAMEGPTPISALIHAATMVTAGVYLIARFNPLFHQAPLVLDLVVLIGVAGLLMAGLIALVQTDIKRIIAFSTMSQIAYMFVGVGLMSYWSGVFHLFTHAFFKALLFLGAGLVIHALHGEQDIRNMGGLRKQLPKVYFCMMIGALALSGIFPFSGGFSKDAILSSALTVDTPIGWIAYVGGLIGALLTGIYTFRLMFMVFHRRMSPYAENVIPHSVKHHGEGPSTMLWPVYILSIGAAFAGLLQIPGVTHVFSSWLEPISPYGMVEATAGQDWLTTLIGTTVGLVGIAIAYHLYARENEAPELIRNGHARLIHRALERRLYWDDLYAWTFEKPLQWASGFLNRDVDAPAFRWAPLDGLGQLTAFFGRSFTIIENGIVRMYALVFALGIGAVILYLLVRG